MPGPSPPGSTPGWPHGWAEAKVRPAARADDGEFLRRACLDLVGRIPTAAEARDFLDDPSPDKRVALVERLLDSPAYTARATELWRQLLLPEADDRGQAGRSPAASRPGSGKKVEAEERATTGSSARSSPPSSSAATTAMPRAADRAVARRLLRGQGGQARDPRRRLGAGLPRHPPRMRPVPQPPVRQVEAGGVLGLRRLLRRRPAAGSDDGTVRMPARTPTAAS